MKTQCPICKSEQEIPKEYKGRTIKCLSCKESFIAQKAPPIIIQTKRKPAKPKPPPVPIKCPNCGSTQITGYKKGFSGGKAVGGAIVLGPLGLLAGLHGSKKIVVSCLNADITPKL